MAKFSDSISKNTIEGKVGNQKYIFTSKPDLEEIPFVEAMKDKKRSFLSKFSNGEKIAISVWTTPKRTKTPPWPRVYSTLPYPGKKITIIPVQASYGLYGDKNIIQPATISWITSLGVYLIIGVYTNADKKPKGKQSANANPSKKPTKGKIVFTDFQYDLIEIENQITDIITGNIEIRDWNQMQIKKIPELLYKATEHNKRLGKELDIIVQNFKNLVEGLFEGLDLTSHKEKTTLNVFNGHVFRHQFFDAQDAADDRDWILALGALVLTFLPNTHTARQ